MNTIGPDGLLEHEDEFYVGLGSTPRERQADAALQELLDEVNSPHLSQLAIYLSDIAVGWEDSHRKHGRDRLKLVQLMLHHGWVPPALHHAPLPEPEVADHADVQAWVLAMSFRAKAGVRGGMTDAEEVAWVQIAEQAIDLAAKTERKTND